jgi:intracellular sulfur oxidation DsrE/DsrF family protein
MAHGLKSIQRYDRKPPMKPVLLLLLLLAGLVLLAYFDLAPQLQEQSGEQQLEPAPLDADSGAGAPDSGAVLPDLVLDISVHSLEELRVLLDRAEKLAMRPQPQGEKAGIVLVLHGPEVEFFAIGNYSRYKDVVDQAARLDASDVVDVKICRTMMERLGVERDDIPAFIEQVPYGPGEVERLVRKGYVYF